MGTNILHFITVSCREEYKHTLQSSPEYMHVLGKQDLRIFYRFWGTGKQEVLPFLYREVELVIKAHRKTHKILIWIPKLCVSPIERSHIFWLQFSSFIQSVEQEMELLGCSGMTGRTSVGLLQVFSSNIKIQASQKGKQMTVCFAECDSLCMLFSTPSQMFSQSVLINWKEMEMIYTPTCLRPTNMTMWNFAPHIIVIPAYENTFSSWHHILIR